MKRNNKARILVGLFAIATLAGSLSTVVNTYATSINDLKDRFIAQGFYKCYNGKADGQYIMNGDPISPADVTSWKTLIPYDGDVVGASPDQEYTCAKLFESLPNKVTIPSASAGIVEVNQITPALTKLGYKSTAGSSQKCEDFWLAKYDLNHQKLMDGDDLNIQVCANVDADDKMTKLDISPTDLDDSGHRWSFGIDDQGRIQAWISEWGFFEDLEPDVWYTENNTTWNKFISDLNTALLKWQYGSYSDEHNCEGLCYRYYRRHTSASGSAVTATQYKLDRNAYKTAYNKLTNKTYPSTTFTSGEQAALYQDYLVSYYGIEVNEASCVSSGEPKNPDNSLTIGEDGKTDNWHKAKIYGSDGKEKNCYVNATKNEDKEVYGITGKYPSMVSDGKIGLVGILAWLNSSAPSTIPADLAGTIGQPDSGAKEEDEDSGDEGTKSCYDGAGALGWVLCAVLDGVSSAVDAIYNNFIEPALTINADLLTVGNNEENGAYATWQIFQTFANIIFVIMILVVIFSQLTGVGIDNYGIKRILPRLIIAAILINLSFIICQLLVDLSNILGVSLKNLFDGLGQDVGGTGQVTTAGGHVVSTFVVIITGAVAAGAFLSLGLGVIIPILIAALSALIAIFFLFLVLAGRQAAVVILVVMSPLALVMYMLPNTKQYFDKFIKIFVTLLIVFPICGLVMGGGDFVSRMLLRAGGVTAKVNADGTGFFYQISAILVSIVPFFFIPSLVKNSLAGLGNIGTKISSIGSGVSGRATKTARGGLERSRLGAAAKDRQAYRDQVLQRRRAGINRKGEVTKLGQFRRNVADGKRLKLFTTQAGRDRMKMAMGNAQSEILKSDAALTGAERMLDGSHVEAVRAGMGASDFEQAVKDQAALIDEMTDNSGNRIVDSPEALGNVYSSALSDLSTNPDSSEAKAKVYALQNRLASTDAGRAQLQSRLEAAVDSGQTAGLNAAASHLVNDHAGDIKNVNRGLFNWASQAAGGNISSMASHYADGTDKYTAQTIAAADEAALQHLASSFGGMDSGQQSDIANTAYEALNSDNINLKPEVRKRLEEIVDSAKKAGVTPRITAGQTEAQAQTQALNDINDTLRDIHANQSAPTPPPQPKDNGPSTEDWDNYINGNL